MLVYRVEHLVTKSGPYYVDSPEDLNTPSLRSMSHQWAQHRPSPYKDKGLRNTWENFRRAEREQWKFGFDSMKKLTKWFTITNRKELHKANFIIRIYEVEEDKVLSSNFQSIFQHTFAQLVGEESLI